MKIESQDRNIGQLLKANSFVIPRFQRPYSWDTEQLGEFWSDVIENYGSQYFIGSMVVYSVGRSDIAVVDGQQRLTTITILLCAIRDVFLLLDKKDSAQGLHGYIEQRNSENKTVFVLQTETSYPFLQEHVLKMGEPNFDTKIGSEEQRVKSAYQQFYELVNVEISKFLSNKEKSKEDNIESAATWLAGLRDTVFDLNVIVVTLDNQDDAYLIFETLNTRGKDLALSDLLRNHFAKLIKPVTGVDQSTIKWGEVLDIISGSEIRLDPDTFIVHSWQSRYDFVTKAKTFQKLKAAVDDNNAKSHLDRFVSDAKIWRSIFDVNYDWHSSEREVQRSLSALRIFKVVQPTPGILSLIRAYRDEKIKYKVLRDALSAIEKFHFSFNAITSSRSSGGISGMYSLLGREVYNAADSNKVGVILKSFLEKLRDREVGAIEFDVGFEKIVFTNNHTSDKSLVQYILKKVASEESQTFIGETEDLTLEHLLPQSEIKKGTDELIVGQLGNLILVDQKTNGLLSNKRFSEKKIYWSMRDINFLVC